ncbi:MAG TPA: LLM class flavin-dependent oxidoreductase [Candidatus Binatia bacterium]|jgi:alkanesulfonate monooxygenase SsuD/methylene tetrahydromethanopterin reductase-like flavin-dependent oxidoreductase (luciferase family)
MKIDIEFNSGAQLPMDAIPELARLAEAHGFGCAWGGEANNKDPTVMLAAIAAVTKRLEVGSAVYHILGRTPATLALQAAGLDELSSGRFLLGIGSSNPTIAKWHGQSMDHPLKRVEEYIAIVRAAMRGEKLSFSGQYFSAHNFKIAFKPSGRLVPIYLAAFGPKMTRLAGRISDGVLINMANPTEIRRIVAEARAGAQEAGKDPAALEIICKIRCSIAQSHDIAREALSHALAYYALADYYRELLGRMGFANEVEAMRVAWKAQGFHAARRLVSDRMFSSLPLVAATSATEVVAQIKPYADAGATRIILPYVAASDDVVGEMRNFITNWSQPTDAAG